MSATEPDYKALVREALTQITSLKRQLREQEAARYAPIAIVGYGCRLPGGVSDERSFWKMLQQPDAVISATASERFNLDPIYDPVQRRPGKTYARALGMVSGYESFDAGFFGLSDLEAERLDPQQRLLLETSWEAFERAGVVPESLAGSDTGVYVGISTQEYGVVTSALRYPEEFAACDGPGNSLAVAAGRLSYFYGFKGPALAIDTACSSVLVCVHEAMQALRAGKVDTALAGGVNLIINPLMMLVFAQAGVLSSSGQQRCFDAAGDGYVRSEACTMVVLKRLDDAVAEGLPVLAVLNGAAVNHGGRSQGITTPNEAGQLAVMQAALEDAGLTAADIDCVEAHATGTQLGDFIELSALQEVYGRERERPLWLTSVKARVGHAETGSAGPSLLSAMFQLKAGQVAGQLHYNQPNPLFEWQQSPLQVATAPMPWPGSGIAAVSGFGYNGTNAHVILSAPPTIEASRPEAGVHGLKLSARSADALRDLAAAWLAYLALLPAEKLPDALAMANGGRTDFDWRAWVPGDSPTTLLGGCAALARGEGLPIQPVRSGKAWPAPALPLSANAVGDLVQAWLKGATVRWRDLYPVLPVIDVPTYAFQRRKFWPQFSNSIVQRVFLQRLSQMQLFLGQHFPEPAGMRYHGYLGDDHPTLVAGYRVHGHNGVPPLWPLAAIVSTLPACVSRNVSKSDMQRFSGLVWGEWPRLAQDQHLRLHTECSNGQWRLQWATQESNQWRLAFRADQAGEAVAEQLVTTSTGHTPEPKTLNTCLKRGDLFDRLQTIRVSGKTLQAALDVRLPANPHGSWVDATEGEYAQQGLALLGILQAGFDLCQGWAADGEVLLPGSCETLDLNIAALLDCLQQQHPLQTQFDLEEEAGGGLLAHWRVLDAHGNVLLDARQLVLYRVDAERLGGQAVQAGHFRQVPRVDLSRYRDALETLAALPPEQRASTLLDILLQQMREVAQIDVDAEASLLSLGVDSLWAMDFRARLQTELGLLLPLSFLLQGPTLTQLAVHLAGQIGSENPPSSANAARPVPETASTPVSITHTIEDDVELML